MDVSVHGFWKWGTTALFDMRIFNLDAVSYLRQTSAKALETADKKKKDKYLQPCLERRHSFTPMVHSADGITGTYSVVVQRHLALLLSKNLKREYLDMCGFVSARMSLAIVSSNTLLLRGARDKEVCIRKRPNLEDGALMALMAP